MTDDKTRQLENRIDKLESTIDKMMPSRRDALKMGGAALVGGAAMSGTASAGTNQVGTIGSQASPVDLESEDINNADTVTTDTLDSTTVNNSGTVTTQDIVVNGTATGPFGGGGVLLEDGEDFDVIGDNFSAPPDKQFFDLYNGTAKTVLSGFVGGFDIDFLYEFSSGNTITQNGGVGTTTYTDPGTFSFEDNGGGFQSISILPPAKEVVKIRIAAAAFASPGAKVFLKD